MNGFSLSVLSHPLRIVYKTYSNFLGVGKVANFVPMLHCPPPLCRVYAIVFDIGLVNTLVPTVNGYHTY